MSANDWMVSVDDHIIEPAHVWVDRLPEKYRDLGPRWISDEHGESWLFEGKKRIPIDSMGTGGATYPASERPPMFTPLTWSQVDPACYDPKARVEAMDRDHEIAALCFPNMAGFAGSLFQRAEDKDLALLCIQAYNDWFIDEWCAAYPGRFISMAMIPLWDGKLAAAEAERCLNKGARSVTFTQSPQNLGFPILEDDYWQPLFSLMNEANLPLCTHLGTGMQQAEEDKSADWAEKMRNALKNNDLDEVAKKMQAEAGVKRPRSRRLRPGTSTSLIGAKMGQETLTDWFESGLFERYDNLKLVLSENGVGWIPSTLSLADWTEQINRTADETPSARPFPSDLFREHVFGCFIDEPLSQKLLDEVGVDNIMIESDFPHTATNWPNSMERVDACLAGLDDESRHKILRGNAERVFCFEAAEIPVLVS